MKKRFYVSLLLLGMACVCAGVSGCGKESGSSTDASVPVEVGEHIEFGSYQGEKIEWRVLDVKDGNLLLLSEYGLDAKPYNETSSHDIGWEDCTLRQWLNQDFYESAFSDEEKQKILSSTSEGFSQYNSRVVGGDYTWMERETEDWVFLLSYTEAYKYVSGDGGDGTDKERFCYPTEYAKNNTELNLFQDVCGWWLCTGSRRYDDSRRTAVVSNLGSIHVEEDVSSEAYAVRPAIWMKY